VRSRYHIPSKYLYDGLKDMPTKIEKKTVLNVTEIFQLHSSNKYLYVVLLLVNFMHSIFYVTSVDVAQGLSIC
jgi:hypothetical protein